MKNLLPCLVPQPTKGLSADPSLPSPFEGAVWFAATDAGDGFTYEIPPGSLPGIRWFTCDLLNDQPADLVMNLEFHEPDNEQAFLCRFTLLPRAQARLRFNTEALSFNRWRYNREGACLKPTIGGWRVDPALVDRIVLKVLYKAPGPAHWCMTPLTTTIEEPPMLTDPVLLDAPLLDELGQATFREWPAKTRSAGELIARLSGQLAGAPAEAAQPPRSLWGGWDRRKVEATGFFRTHHDGNRWWLVDPDGHLFWSAGPDCVVPKIESNIRGLHSALAWLPPREGYFADCFGDRDDFDLTHAGENEPFDYLIANLIRAFGDSWRENWARIVYPLLRGIGFNTCGNWSDCEAASKAGMPYVFPIPAVPASRCLVPRVFRDFPDVFDPEFEREAGIFAESLRATAGDPAMIGYFLMNEPQWGFARMYAAEGMLRNTPSCASRRAFSERLRTKYETDAGLSSAWRTDVSFAEISEGIWDRPFTAESLGDVAEFSTVMVRKLYDTLSAACRAVDQHHLNLGARFSSAPEDWILEAMGSFDVFSINCYQLQADAKLATICQRLNVPALIGEWHFGAIDAGLPAPGIGHCANQAGRGQAYRYFVESSAAQPWCVGAHWFTLYDQSALGRMDGENYNIGFLDTCHRLYEPLADAARLTHERLYDVAVGAELPFSDVPEILPRLNM